MEKILNTYYSDNAQKLHKIVDQILQKYGGISDKDRDDFYSLANEVFTDVIRRYDQKQPFEGFLYSCLSNRIKTEITRRNRMKRSPDRLSVSMELPVDGEEEATLGDMLPGAFDLEIEIFGQEEYSEKMLLYLNKLSNTQRKILRFMAEGYTPGEIQEELQMNKKEYSDCDSAIHSYRNISVLF